MVILKYPGEVIIEFDFGYPPYKVYLNGKLLADNIIAPTYKIDYIQFVNMPFNRGQIVIEDSSGNIKKEGWPVNNRFTGQLKEILRREHVWFKHFSGEFIYIFKRRKFGIPCTNCYDEDYNIASDSQCEVCYGTRFVGGYFPPVKTFGILAPNELLEQQSVVEPIQVIYQNWYLSPAMPVSVDDIIFAPFLGNKIYRITGVRYVEYHGFTLRQEIASSQLLSSDITYKFIEEYPINDYDDLVDWYLYTVDRYKYLIELDANRNFLLDLLDTELTNKSIETGFYYNTYLLLNDSSDFINLQNAVITDNSLILSPTTSQSAIAETVDISLNPPITTGFLIGSLGDSPETVEYSIDGGTTWNQYTNVVTNVQSPISSIKLKFTESTNTKTIKVPYILYK